MSKLCLVLFVGIVAGAATRDVVAIPVFLEKFTKQYAGETADQTFTQTVRTTKCNVCHVPEAKKKVLNHYGQQLAKLLNKRDFAFQRLQDEPEQVEMEIFSALKKLEAESAPQGMTYGQRIRSGRLPAHDD